VNYSDPVDIDLHSEDQSNNETEARENMYSEQAWTLVKTWELELDEIGSIPDLQMDLDDITDELTDRDPDTMSNYLYSLALEQVSTDPLRYCEPEYAEPWG